MTTPESHIARREAKNEIRRLKARYLSACGAKYPVNRVLRLMHGIYTYDTRRTYPGRTPNRPFGVLIGPDFHLRRGGAPAHRG